MFLIKEYNC